MSAQRIVGILLAAGRGMRFGADKRQVAVNGAAGDSIAVAACRNLLAAVPETIAVVRPGDDAIAAALADAGARTVACADADEGMGRSLACGVAATPDADGWVVALADMPWIAVATIGQVARALREGADLVAPSCGGHRGHPVGFCSRWRDALCALGGDRGARPILEAHLDCLTLIEVPDPGILRDVDYPEDLAKR